MKEIIIDKEFQSLLPALTKETYGTLEADLLENGCRDAIVLWNDILIDGHNRYEICTKHDIPYNTISKEFAAREEVLIWIISTQVGRRNLTPMQLSHYRGILYRADKKLVSNTNGKNQYSEVDIQNEYQPKTSTVKRLAEQYNVALSTIQRDVKLADAIDAIGEISTEAKQRILTGEANISKKELEALSSKPTTEINEVAEKIESGEFEKRKPASAPKEQKKAVDSIFAGIKPLNTAIDRISNKVSSILPKVTETGDRSEIRTAIRACMERLEDLYKQI